MEQIEPRLTPHRPAAPANVAEVLIEGCRDLEQELTARLELMTPEDLRWQPHPDSNSAGVTVWHVARWLDVLGSRVYTGRAAREDVWHTQGWLEETGYEPDGLGFLGMGALTGYTPEQMRAAADKHHAAADRAATPFAVPDHQQHPARLLRSRRRDRHPWSRSGDGLTGTERFGSGLSRRAGRLLTVRCRT